MVEALLDAVDREVDLFDLICHVGFDQPPLSRKERANQVRKRNYFTRYGEQAQKVLEALLDKYADEGISNIKSMEVLRVKPLTNLAPRMKSSPSLAGKPNTWRPLKHWNKHFIK